MFCHLYKFECLTPLHVGSGEANYNIIDNEVERDPVTRNPIVHASGLKGAFRAHFSALGKCDINKIFGKPSGAAEDAGGSGSYKFFDAKILSRPMRVSSGSMSSVSVTSVEIVNAYLKLAGDFGCNPYGINSIPSVDFKECEFLTNAGRDIRVEDEEAGELDAKAAAALATIFGSEKIALAKTFNAYPLPVVAHNKIDMGESKHLWYEEFVPAGSVFTFMIMTPEDNMELPLTEDIIQIGANASIGYGYIKITKLN